MPRSLAHNIKTSMDTGRLIFPEENLSADFVVTRAENGFRLVAIQAVTITVPTVGALGDGFECAIINDSGGEVIIAGPGATDITMAVDEIACIIECNGRQRVVIGVSTVIS